ncbi:MAG: glycoside hydrolase family 3 C-terminal domain-containing protein [Caulobacteraceae bacterium]
METYRDRRAPLEDRVGDLMSLLTLEEKVGLLAGSAWFQMQGVERLGIAKLSMSDGPTGVRSIRGEFATVFPVGVALAASWNPETAGSVARAIAREARDLGEQVVLAPTINIMRIPTWGRNFETYSEDPFLTAKIGVAYVQGLQSEGVGASLKHYAANNQELERFEVDARPGERAFREIYLYAFEEVVRAADPWTVMASYNRFHGEHASQSRRLLTEILKEEWNYPGVVVSDWGAVRSTAAAASAGLDLEMPGPARWFGEKLRSAVGRGEVTENQIEENARRIVRLILRSGLLDGPLPAGERRTARHRAIALEAAIDGMTLLKNDGLLPLDPALSRVALIGPNARRCKLQGGGSSQVVTDARRSLVDGLRDVLGSQAEIVEAQGADNDVHPPIPHQDLFSLDERRARPGLKAEYFESPGCAGAPRDSEPETSFVRRVRSSAGEGMSGYGSLRWSGWLWPPRSGEYEFSARATGAPELFVDEQRMIGPDTASAIDTDDVLIQPVPRRRAKLELAAGRPYRFRLDYTPASEGFEYLGIGLRSPSESMEAAVEAARSAEAAILVLGSGATTESEGYDRPNMDLPGDQDALARAVIAANPNTVVVMNTGSPFSMPWSGEARALLQMWLPGEAGPDALARVLFGKAEPGGRLPMSWPARFGDHPAHVPGPNPKVCEYGEGLLVGYRHYDQADAPPLFPFGHGLSYARFEFSAASAPASAARGETVRVEATVTNHGDRPGREVVQLYVAPLSPRLTRPPKELKGFVKVQLEPRESRLVSFELPPRAFSFYDPALKEWVVEAGNYDLLLGRSAADVRLTQRLTLR